jgi:hypothetical protein
MKRNEPIFKLSEVSSTGTDYRSSSESSFGSGTMELTPESFISVDFKTEIKDMLFQVDPYLFHDDDENDFDDNRGRKTLSLNDCLDLFTKTEKLGSEDPWYCKKCKKHQEATKKFDLWKLPEILVVHLKRFSYNRIWRDKIDSFIDFPIKQVPSFLYLVIMKVIFPN